MARKETKATDKRVALIGGREDVLRRDALRAIFKELGLDAQNLESGTEAEMVIADQRPPVEWIGSVSSVPFLTERRVVVVRNLLRRDPAQEWDAKPKSKDHPFVKELAALPPSAMLVLVADDEAGDEDRQSRLETVAKRWTDIVTAADGHVFVEPASTDLLDDLRKTAKAEGKHLTPGAAALLAEMSGGSVSIAKAELAKLVAYVGKAEAVQEQDVKAVVAPEQDYNVYQLVDAVVAGDGGGALRQLRMLTGRNDKIESQAFSRIFPTIARQFRVVWQARLCLDANCRPADPSAAVLAMFPTKPRINEERDWSQNRAVRAARKLSLGQIRSVFQELYDADAKIKGQLPGYSTVETVEEMILRMSAVCRN